MKTEYDPFASLEYDKERERANHRRSRKSKLEKHKRTGSLNGCIGQTACKYGKRMLHRYNRRNWNSSTLYHKVKDYSFGDIVWSLT